MPNKNHKLAAIVFTDIVGYTRQMEEDEQRTMQLLQKQREIVFPLVKEYDGEVVKEIGDGLLIMFSSAVEAVRFAIKMQQALKDEELTIRAGIHMGDVIFKDGDVFGSAVNTAARIEPLAVPNGICISENVKEQLGNKDIRMISCGRKELKGVNRPIEVFEVFVEGVSQERKMTTARFLKELWNSYVIQITLGYLLAAWIIKLAVSAIVARNFLSPYIVELTWVILVSLLPTVIIISYFHGKRERNKWHKAELIGLPTNILLSVLLVVFMFKGKDLGAATQSVIVQNEDGENVECYIVKSEFRKKICLFNIKNISSDEKLNWLQYTLPTMVEYDLMQDQFITPLSAVKFFQKLVEAGFQDGLELPIGLMKKFSNYYHLNYFMSGTFDYVNGEYVLTTKLYETKNGKLVKTRTLKNKDIFLLTDDLTIAIKKDMGIPKAHIEEVNDLPISEIFTNSFEALHSFSMANKELVFGNWGKAGDYFEESVKEDDGFTIAYVALAQVYFNTNQIEKAGVALKSAMDNIDKVPERLQFNIKFFNYLLKQEPEKALAVLKMWAELYPEDVDAHTMLAQRYQIANRLPEAIAECKTILRMDPERYNYISVIGDLYETMGKPDSALYYYEQYAEKFPKEYKSYVHIGNHYKKTADFANAKKYYEKALLLEPSNVAIAIKLAKTEYQSGKLDTIRKDYEKILGDCNSAKDSSEVYSAMADYFSLRGKIDTSLKYREKAISLMNTFKPPLQVTAQKIFSVAQYVEAGRKKEAFDFLEQIKSELNPPLDKIAAFGYMFVYLELEDADKAEKEIPDAKELARIFGEEVLLANVYYAQAKINEIRGEYGKAIENYDTFFEHQPSSFGQKKNVARVYRKMKEYDKAEENILLALKHSPYSGKANYEAALLYSEMGENEKALDHLKIANKVWEDADPGYKEANEAKAKLNEMESGS
ncbi:MAG: hypothetical protein GXO89_13675 [Chlorobi bacterium]|nr:hypothetical protein [Chlorobiota bacterium]